MAGKVTSQELENTQVPGHFLLKVEIKEPVDDNPKNSRLVRTHYVFCELSASVNFSADGQAEGNPWMSQKELERLLESQKAMTEGVAEVCSATVLIGPGDATSAWTVAGLTQSKQSFPSQSFQSVPRPPSG